MSPLLVASCLFSLLIGLKTGTAEGPIKIQDGQVEIVDAVAGRGLVLECHLSQLQNWTGKLTFYWERWAGSSRIPATSRRRRHHRHRRLIHQEETSGAALRLASIGQQDEGLYRCVATILSARPVVPARLSDDNVDRVVTNATRIDPVADNGTLIQDIVIEEDDIDLEEESGQKFESKTLYGSFIYVRLQVPAVLTDFPESPVLVQPHRRKQQRLKCLAYGYPAPVVDWRVDNNNNSIHQVGLWDYIHPAGFSRAGPDDEVRLIQETDSQEPSGQPRNLERGYVRSVVRIDWNRQQDEDDIDDEDNDVWQVANVTCTATNFIAGQRQTDTRMFNLERFRPTHVAGAGQDDEASAGGENGAGYCGRYTGQVCRGQLSNSMSVWYNISSNDQSGGWLNEQLVSGLWEEVVRSLRQPCQSAAKKLLCLYAFPECHLDEDGFARRLPLCYEDCMATKQLFCVDDWAALESNKQRGFYLGSRGHFRLPRCENLPRMGSRNYFMSQSKYGQDPSSCSRAHLTQLIPAEVTTSCVKGRGRFYQGNVSVTRDGIACQRWDAQEPHSHNRPPLNIFPEMQGAENFCRNAGGEEPRPWCYTTDPLVRWQHCDIPQCGHSEVEVTLLPMEATLTPGFVLLLAGVGFLSLLILLLFLLLCQRAFKHKQGYQLPSLQKESIDLQKLRDNSTYQCVGARIDPSLEKLEYPRNDIIYIRDIGQGAFGRVFQAKAPNLVKGEACTIVAVKTLKEEADDEMCANFEKEACLLAELDHANIIGLLGVCALGKPMCLLLEFMELGDLRQYLRSCCPSNYIAMPAESGSSAVDLTKDVKLSSADLTSMGRQIADGMVYLSQRGFVHRDLATRNCLVSSNGPPSSGGGVTVKIADFGLSQRVHWQQYYYTGTDNDAIPIRWMPLESIIFNRYTTWSDVWAFGVCLWEIFSYAQQPYQGMSHEEVVRYLQTGGVLQPPTHASCAIYAVMRSCWRSSAAERPSFVELHDELIAIEEALCCQSRPDSDPPPVHL